MKKTNLLLLLLLLLSGSLLGQQDSTILKLNKFVDNIEKFNFLYPQEKVYLHFDNTAYYRGETIWFKSYVVTAENNMLSPLSKVLYVELLTPEGDILETKKLKIENGQAHGEFTLKDSLYSGFYEVRAYTKCMLNFDENGIFSRVFPVYDKPRVEGVYSSKTMTVRPKTKRVLSYREKTEKLDKIDISFYPEGGNLVYGLSNKIAFKATDKQGKSIDVSGIIYNSKGDEITTFSSVYQGMGSFILYPDGQKYTAKIIAGKDETKVDLPESLESGYTLQTDNLNSQYLRVQLNKTADLPNDTLGVTFTCRGKVYAFEKFSITEGEPSLLTILKSNLPSGVIQITVFNKLGEILAERLAFINHDNTLQIKSDINATYAPLSPISIDFRVEDKQGNPVETTFSLSVRDKGTEIQTGYTDDINTNLLLSSELKGYIENPAYYFEKDDNKHKFALDLLMLTQGWRRYAWNQLAGIEPIEIKYGIEKSLIVEGQVLSVVKRKEMENVEVTMWMLTPYQKGKCITDSQGNFNLVLNDFYGKTELNIETRKKSKLEEYRVLLDRVFSPTPKTIVYDEQNFNFTAPKSQILSEETIEKPIEKTKVYKPSEITVKSDSIAKTLSLREITVTEKKKWKREQEAISQASVIYNVSKEIEKLEDVGESEPYDVLDFIRQQHNLFICNSYLVKDTLNTVIYKVICQYMSKDVIFLINNSIARVTPFSDFTQEAFNNYNASSPANDFVNLCVSDLDIRTVESIVIAEDSKFALGYCQGCDRSKEYTIIYINTKKEGANRHKNGIRKTSFEGYSNVREFFAPNYKDVVLPDEKDFRRTLYWNPDVKTDKEGKVSVSFYNNRNCKYISIFNEGITKNGIIVR
ncbi:MAG: hypothetical protein PHS59_14925 [Paludibacter sp.]|nr:hypothetical protein [Paludibacter sp.]